MIDVNLHDVLVAHKRIAGSVFNTPLLYSDKMSELRGAQVWMKMESAQRTGSFKIRGASNRLLALTPADRQRGVITTSSGNFALGLGMAARAAKVMPSPSHPMLRRCVRSAGPMLHTPGW